jgi:hypothetical protein
MDSPHPAIPQLARWKQEFQWDTARADGRLERTCDHGIGHPVGHLRGYLFEVGVNGLGAGRRVPGDGERTLQRAWRSEYGAADGRADSKQFGGRERRSDRAMESAAAPSQR